jgi:hypothetical protein
VDCWLGFGCGVGVGDGGFGCGVGVGGGAGVGDGRGGDGCAVGVGEGRGVGVEDGRGGCVPADALGLGRDEALGPGVVVERGCEVDAAAVVAEPVAPLDGDPDGVPVRAVGVPDGEVVPRPVDGGEPGAAWNCCGLALRGGGVPVGGGRGVWVACGVASAVRLRAQRDGGHCSQLSRAQTASAREEHRQPRFPAGSQ